MTRLLVLALANAYRSPWEKVKSEGCSHLSAALWLPMTHIHHVPARGFSFLTLFSLPSLFPPRPHSLRNVRIYMQYWRVFPVWRGTCLCNGQSELYILFTLIFIFSAALYCIRPRCWWRANPPRELGYSGLVAKKGNAYNPPPCFPLPHTALWRWNSRQVPQLS